MPVGASDRREMLSVESEMQAVADDDMTQRQSTIDELAQQHDRQQHPDTCHQVSLSTISLFMQCFMLSIMVMLLTVVI